MNDIFQVADHSFLENIVGFFIVKAKNDLGQRGIIFLDVPEGFLRHHLG